ncbi:hypothetical protein MFLAVUS_010407 [Mucor flavus]|uniref:Uncharacterized protein n=1 Tax=Mucor flavus TaxID=439312 RepID=A0ABP9ZCL6_9FUNG
MGDTADLMEKRRARRQRKILASAESRLSMITGTQSEDERALTYGELGFRESPTPSPSTSTTSLSLVEEKNTLAEHYPSPNDPRRQKYEEKLLTPGKHRAAVQKAIEEEQADELNEGLLGGKISQILLAGMMRKTNPPVAKSCHPANKYWNLLHFISMAWLGFLAVYEEISYHGFKQVVNLIKDPSLKENTTVHFPVFWYFVILEITLHFGRSMYQPDHNRIKEESTFTSIAYQLPESLQPSGL